MTGTVPDVHRRRPRLAGGWHLWPQAVLRGAGLPVEWMLGLAGSAGDVGALLDHPEFAAAITWQNPAAARSWVTANLDPGHRKLSGYRRAVLGRYAQRYCTKNDTIGFFGPVGWAELDGTAAEPVHVEGRGGVRRAQVFLEHWAVAALAGLWAEEEALAPHVPVRLNPAATRADGTATLPARPALPLSTDDLAFLDELGDHPDGAVPAPAHRAAVTSLVERGLLRRGFRLPVSAHPERLLRVALEAVPDARVRAEYLGRLARLDAAVAALGEVWAQPVALLAALRTLDDVLLEIGGPQPYRTGAKTDAGRTPVYLDCRRDSDVMLGAAVLDPLTEPLGLLLESARWLTAQFAEAVHAKLHTAYAQLLTRGTVTLADLHFAAAELLTGADGTADEIVSDFQLRWQEILLTPCADSGTGEIQVPLHQAAAMVAALFPADRPGWAAARNHSPDLLLARTEDGYRWVLGELHVAMNTMESRFFHDMCDEPTALLGQAARDFESGRVVPCYPTEHGVDSRRYPPLATHVEGSYLYWSFAADDGPHPAAAGSLPATELVVEPRAGELHAGPADRSWSLPVIEFFGEFLTALVVSRFTLLPRAARRPRVLLGDLVVARRTWTLHPEDLPPNVVGQRGYRTDAICASLAARGVPRYVFVRTRFQSKPVYVDLESPLTLANLARMWLAAAERDGDERVLEISEMLPTPDELWLTDERGRHYTTEFRMVAVDPSCSGDLRAPWQTEE